MMYVRPNGTSDGYTQTIFPSLHPLGNATSVSTTKRFLRKLENYTPSNKPQRKQFFTDFSYAAVGKSAPNDQKIRFAFGLHLGQSNETQEKLEGTDQNKRETNTKSDEDKADNRKKPAAGGEWRKNKKHYRKKGK